jgi:hypothetical protein
MLVPVIDKEQNPLMPTTPSRARRWIKLGKATPFWKRGIFCVRLNTEPSDDKKQKVVVGIDTGSKREAYTVATEKQVVLNILTNTPDWVSESMSTRRDMRKARRSRKTPCRKPNPYKGKNKAFLPPSIKARWQTKIRLVSWLNKILPITDIIIEDIKAFTKKGHSKWNDAFSNLEVGKTWLYEFFTERFGFYKILGSATKKHREKREFRKATNKLEESWEAHNVDSHCLTELFFSKNLNPMTRILRVEFLRFHRRQLHRFHLKKGGNPERYGSTMSLGFKRGSIIKHPTYQLTYIGGYKGDRLSLHDLKTGKRLSQKIKPNDCNFKTYSSWRWSWIGVPS